MSGRTNGKRRMEATRTALPILEAIESRVLMSTNVPVGEPFQVNEFTAGGQYTGMVASRSIAADAAGSFVVVWSSTQQGSVMARLFDADGTPRGGEFRV